MLILPNILTFNPADHTYWHKTKNSETEVPCVSNILSHTEVGEDYSGAKRNILLDAQRRGTRVHRAIELYDNGVLDNDSVHYEDSLFFDNYLRFMKDYPCFKTIYSEKQFFYNVDNKPYSGTMDKVFSITPGKYRWGMKDVEIGEGEIAIVDFKTGSHVAPSARYQLMAYRLGLSQGCTVDDTDVKIMDELTPIIGRLEKIHLFILQLRPDAYTFIPVKYEQNAWESILIKYYNPDAKINLKKLCKHQIELPVELAKQKLSLKVKEEKIKEEDAALRENIIQALTVDGFTYNGKVEVDGYSVTFSKGLPGYSTSVDYEAAFKTMVTDEHLFLRNIHIDPKENYTRAEVEAMMRKCQKDFFEVVNSTKTEKISEGSFALKVTKLKTIQIPMEDVAVKTISVPESPKTDDIQPEVIASADIKPDSDYLVIPEQIKTVVAEIKPLDAPVKKKKKNPDLFDEVATAAESIVPLPTDKEIVDEYIGLTTTPMSELKPSDFAVVKGVTPEEKAAISACATTTISEPEVSYPIISNHAILKHDGSDHFEKLSPELEKELWFAANKTFVGSMFKAYDNEVFTGYTFKVDALAAVFDKHVPGYRLQDIIPDKARAIIAELNAIYEKNQPKPEPKVSQEPVKAVSPASGNIKFIMNVLMSSVKKVLECSDEEASKTIEKYCFEKHKCGSSELNADELQGMLGYIAGYINKRKPIKIESKQGGLF